MPTVIDKLKSIESNPDTADNYIKRITEALEKIAALMQKEMDRG